MKTFTKRKFIYYFAVIVSVLAAAFLLAACKGNEYNGAGAAEIKLTVNGTYEGDVTVGCPEGVITQSGNVYSIKVGSRKMTDVIVSCEGYFTETVTVYTKDYVGGVAEKEVELRKRVNTLTLNVSGVTDATDVKVESKNDLIKEKAVSGRKIIIYYKDFVSDADGEVDELSISCDGYYTNSLSVNKGYFVDYSASLAITLLSTSSNDAAITFVNDIDSSRYRIVIYEAVSLENKSVTSVEVTTSATRNLDKNKNYYIKIYGNYGNNNTYYTPIVLSSLPQNSPYMTVRLKEISGIENAKQNYGGGYESYVKLSVDSEMAELGRHGNNISLYKEDGAKVDFGLYNIEEKRLFGVKVGDKIRVVAHYDWDENNKLAACYTQTVTNEGLKLEKKFDENLKVKISFVDPFGKPMKISDSGKCVTLFNSYGVDGRLLREVDKVYLDVLEDSYNLDVATADDEVITLDVSALMGLEILGGRGKYTDEHPCIYIDDGTGENPERIELYNLLVKDAYKFVIAEDLDFKVRFVKYNPDASKPVEYITDINTQYTGIEKDGDYYTFTVPELTEKYFDLYTDNTVRYARMTLFALKDFYEKSGNHYTVDITLYEEKGILIESSTENLPQDDCNRNINIGGESLWLEYNKGYEEGGRGGFVFTALETYIGKSFTITIESYRDGTRYTASGTFTKEDFLSGTLHVSFTRTQTTDQKW